MTDNNPEGITHEPEPLTAEVIQRLGTAIADSNVPTDKLDSVRIVWLRDPDHFIVWPAIGGVVSVTRRPGDTTFMEGVDLHRVAERHYRFTQDANTHSWDEPELAALSVLTFDTMMELARNIDNAKYSPEAMQNPQQKRREEEALGRYISALNRLDAMAEEISVEQRDARLMQCLQDALDLSTGRIYLIAGKDHWTAEVRQFLLDNNVPYVVLDPVRLPGREPEAVQMDDMPTVPEDREEAKRQWLELRDRWRQYHEEQD